MYYYNYFIGPFVIKLQSKQINGLKVVSLHSDLRELVASAVSGDRRSQRLIYQKFSPKLLSICRQYVADEFAAEDLLVTTFLKIFNNLAKYEHKGPFEAWIRRITVNECISYIRANKKVRYTEPGDNLVAEHKTDGKLLTDDIQGMIDALPEGCKMVFNLYAVEGYKHQEIATMLNINEGTSKSQLAYARRLLQEMIIISNKTNHG